MLQPSSDDKELLLLALLLPLLLDGAVIAAKSEVDELAAPSSGCEAKGVLTRGMAHVDESSLLSSANRTAPGRAQPDCACASKLSVACTGCAASGSMSCIPG
jgi:hypothetical protein